jgi:uncharacterized RDD family membrane protein YckC
MAANTGSLASKKAEIVPRAIAAIIDGVIASVGYAILGGILGLIYWRLAIIGWAVAAGFYLLRDTLLEGQSPGKKLMKLQAVNAKTGAKLTQEESIKRNLVPASGYVVALITLLPLGWLLSIPASLALLAASLYEIWIWYNDRDKEGRRWGDQLAGTIVISLEQKEAAVEEEVGS